jgi:hypothetical protein
VKNLAGDKDCDREIRRELARARIEIVEGDRTANEVPYSVTGKIGPFTFGRAWYYWIVTGPVPLDVARELYADPVGRDDVRTGGHAGNYDPDASYGIDYFDGSAFISSYHIDTEVGLRLFVDTLRKHGLDDAKRRGGGK